MMNKVDIGSDDFITGSTFVKLGNVASAIGKVLLANGSPNRLQAERDAWPFIHTGIVAGKLHPLAPETLDVLSINDYGNGVVGFDELAEWGRWCHRFDFVKECAQAAPDAKADEIQALIASRKARLERAITPQGSGRAHRYSPPPITVKPPKWDYWRHMPTAAPWEACALALNIEPDSVDYRPESWDGQPETWRGFPSDEIGDHFIKLLRLLNSNQFESQHFTENFAMGVRLPEFAVWCAPVVRDLIGSDIPKELAAMAKNAPQAASPAKCEVLSATTSTPAAKGETASDGAKEEAKQVPPTAPVTTTHRIKKRDRPLDAEIKIAKERALDKTSTQSVWDELVKMAGKQEGCLLGEGDLDEIKYGSRLDPQIFTKKLLGDRLNRKPR